MGAGPSWPQLRRIDVGTARHRILTYVECDAFDETDVAVLVDCGQVDEPQIAQGGSLRVEGSVEVGVVGVGTANGPPG